VQNMIDDRQDDNDGATADLDVTGYAEHLRDVATDFDYKIEAYGDRCPGCGTPRFGGDCGNCYDGDSQEYAAAALDRAVAREGGR
jgi:hypothetical protein